MLQVFWGELPTPLCSSPRRVEKFLRKRVPL